MRIKEIPDLSQNLLQEELEEVAAVYLLFHFKNHSGHLRSPVYYKAQTCPSLRLNKKVVLNVAKSGFLLIEIHVQ